MKGTEERNGKVDSENYCNWLDDMNTEMAKDLEQRGTNVKQNKTRQENDETEKKSWIDVYTYGIVGSSS